MRVDEKVQNPVLRLGKTGNNYGQLLSQSSIDTITQQFRAVRGKYPNQNEQIEVAIGALRSGVEGQVDTCRQISRWRERAPALARHFKEWAFVLMWTKQ